jgi:hypothetical protein
VYPSNYWCKDFPAAEFLGISCTFSIPVLSSYGGNTIGSLPNGATYYDFNDAYELPIDTAQTQNNKQAKYCS